VLQVEDICFLKDRSLSKMTPKFRVDVEGVIGELRKDIEEDVSLHRCCGEPMIRYSVLDGFTVRRLDVSQA
jgi:hypothetical protein